jgi:hypothetical protein
MEKILFCPEGTLGQPKFFLRPMIVCSRNLVLRKDMLLSKQQKVAWDSQTRISEPDRRTNEQGVDDSDDDDIDSDASTARQDQH